MSETTPVSGLVIAEDLDILNTEAAFGQLAVSMDTQLVPRFATTAARNAAIAAPTEGMICSIGTTAACLQRYTGSAWVNAEERQFGLMTADVTHTTTATPSNLTGVAVTLEAGGIYAVENVTSVDGTVNASAVDYLLSYTYSGTVPTPFLFEYSGTLTATTGQIKNVTLRAGAGAFITMGTSAGPEVMYTTWVFRPTTAGTLQFQGAQRVAGAEVLATIALGTWVSARRIG